MVHEYNLYARAEDTLEDYMDYMLELFSKEDIANMVKNGLTLMYIVLGPGESETDAINDTLKYMINE